MEFFLIDPQVARLPPAKTPILDLRAESYTDGKRVRINLELTPFLLRPEIELTYRSHWPDLHLRQCH